MASDALKVGGPAGVEAILKEQFKEPAEPTVGRAKALQRIHAKIVAANLPCQRLDLSDDPVHRGALIDMSHARVPFPAGRSYDRCYVALIDPDTQLGWAHGAYWAFVPADSDGDVIVHETDLPEHALGPVRFHPVRRP